MQSKESLVDRMLREKENRPATSVYGGVKDWFRQTFNSDIPVRNLGASDFERKAGWEHSRSFDVGINPSSAQGQQLLKYLDSQGIPYSAFTGAVSRGGRTIATGPHIHVGPPSKSVSSGAEPAEFLVDRLLREKEGSGQQTRGITPPPSVSSVPGFGALSKFHNRDTRPGNPLQVQIGAPGFGGNPLLPAIDRQQTAALREDENKRAQQTRGAMRNIVSMAGSPTQLLPNAAQDWLNETLGDTAASVMTTSAGMIRHGVPALEIAKWLGAPDVLQKPLADKLNRGAQEIAGGTQAMKATSGRSAGSQAVQDVVGGFGSSAPAMALVALGVPAPVAFGLHANLEAQGRDAELRDVIKETTKGAAIGALFELPLPAKQGFINQIGQRLTKAGLVGGGTKLIETASGSDDTQGALVNALFAATGAGARERAKYRHADFGEVTEAANQGGVQRGKVRVTDTNGIDHVIIKPSIARNQRAIPLSKPPVESPLEPSVTPPQGEVAQVASLPIAVRIAEANQTIQRIESSIQQTKLIKNPTGKTRELRRGLMDKLNTAVKERNLLLDPKLQAALEGTTKAAVIAERRGLGLLGKADHPIADQIINEEVNFEDILDAPVASEVRAIINEAKSIAETSPVTASGSITSTPQVAGGDQGGAGTAEGLKPPPAGERQFPKSAVAAGLPEATDLTYAINTDAGAVERANQRIAQDGAERVASDIAKTTEPSKDDIVAASILAHQLTEAGNIQGAVDVIDNIAVKLTNAGQAVQAASLISRLSPEGILLTAQKRLGRAPTPEEVMPLLEQSKEVRDAEKLIADIQKQYPQIFGENGEILESAKIKSARPLAAKIGTLQDRLTKMETDARARIKERQAKIDAGELQYRASGPTPSLHLNDYIIIGAAKLARKGMSLAQWTDEMVGEFGDAVKPHIKQLYTGSYKIYDENKRDVLQAQRERSALAGGADPADVQRVINDRLDAQTRARKARLELVRTFGDLNKTGLQKVGRTILDIANLPRALVTSLDLSAGMRQGKMGLARHPKVFLDAFLKQFKALSTAQHEQMMSERELRPSFKYAQRFGLDLTTHAAMESSKLGAHEEPFQTGLAEKIPGVKHSEQAYGTMLDELRLGWLEEYMKTAKASGLNPENPADFQAFREGAELINNATGRGNLGRLQGATPILNTGFFSPRFWVSRLKLLSLPFDPRTYTQMSRPARVEAFKTLFSHVALVSSQLALAKLSGAKVTLNPDDPDFGKAVWGPIHIDFSAGFQNHIRAALRLIRAIGSPEPGKGAIDVLGTYGRSKESPNASLIHDLFLAQKKGVKGNIYGTDFKGDPTAILGVPGDRWNTSAAAQRLVPMAFQDAIDAYDELGWSGVAETAPLSILGEGVSVYTPKQRGLKPPPKKSVPVP